ncbi:IS21 family transposase [Candidatus Babeliales bacterium]|nr:IS21 family transposase [Candidatus Babeliales bacterium]
MDIVSLHRQGYSVRAIARELGMHRETVKKHIESNSFPQYKTGKKRGSKLAPYYQVIGDFLKEDSDYQATWIYDRLQSMSYDGSYDLVKRYVREIKERQTRLAYVRFETQPGFQAQVDWGEFQIVYPHSKKRKLYGFMITLGYSRASYVEFVESSKLEYLMDCHINALKYLQGIPTDILYDNMKTVVIGREAGKVKFNNEFLHFAHHYGFCPKACPPYSPWVKGKIERPVDYVRERFWRGYHFTSLEQTNRDVITWLGATANERIHGTHREKVRDRWEREIEHLYRLPANDYDTSEKVFRPVYRDCQLSYNGNFYVVPHEVVGKKVMLKIKHGHIRIYHDQKLLVSYQEPQGKNELVQDERFYERLRRDKEQCRRKYGGNGGKRKGVAKAAYSDVDVVVRPLSEYDAYITGGR